MCVACTDRWFERNPAETQFQQIRSAAAQLHHEAAGLCKNTMQEGKQQTQCISETILKTILLILILYILG